jgi:hypothetical protein
MMHGYDLAWDKSPPIAREMKNSKSLFDHQDIFPNAISEMVEAGAASAL